MFAENECNTFADLKGKSRSNEGGEGYGSPRCLMSERRRHKEIGASADVFNQSLSLSPKRTKVYEITNVTSLMRAPGGGLRDGPK